MGLLIRAGIQILAALPKLYWNEGSIPGTEWLKFSRGAVPADRVWISLEEERAVSSVIAQPGGNNLGLGRHWHFLAALFWIANGLIYLVLLIATNEWRRLVPQSWSVFPDALHTAGDYLTGHLPPQEDFRPYDPLQQLTYAAVVFGLSPFIILTGLAQSPALQQAFPAISKLLGGRQGTRSLHFLGLVAMLGFTAGHTAMVFITGPSKNFGHMLFGGTSSAGGWGVVAGVALIAAIFAVYGLTSVLSLRHPRAIQRAFGSVLIRARRLGPERVVARHRFDRSDISPYFRVNGYPPESPAYAAMAAKGFKDWRLEVGGLVARPRVLTLDELKSMARRSQVTRHNCIQGWSAIAEWAGLPLAGLLDQCGPLEGARFAVFWSWQDDTSGRPFYETLAMPLVAQPETILAYEMNGAPLDVPHGAPLRLRAETQLGFKMVKWLNRIDLVEDISSLRDGMGGSREDNMYYDWTASI